MKYAYSFGILFVATASVAVVFAVIFIVDAVLPR